MDKKIDLSEDKKDRSESEASTAEADAGTKAGKKTMESDADFTTQGQVECDEDTEMTDEQKDEVDLDKELREEEVESAIKSIFGKKDKKEKEKDKEKDKKDKKDEKIAELNDRLMRQMAEFDNFRKRTDREKSQMFEIGVRDVVEKMLPIMDNFERGFTSLAEGEKATPFAQGMDKIFRQMQSTFETLGIKAIEAVGKEFDPNFHNAVMHVEDESVGENIVIEEFQKGYLYKDSVIRHSMVKVAN